MWHTREIETPEKWGNILQLYNQLLQIEYSPIVALNRTFALSKANGKKIAIKEALKIDLSNSHLYHSLLAELYNGIDITKQIESLKNALNLTKTENDRKILQDKLGKASCQHSV